MENYNANELLRTYHKAAHGDAKISALKSAIRQADQAKDIHYQLKFRYYLIEESVFYGDTLDALITFPQLVAMDEQNSGHVDPYDISFCFKWILDDVRRFPQISKKEIESYFEAYKERCKKYGYSLRSYYQKFRNFYMDTDEEKAKEANWKMQMSKRDALSDCQACELDEQLYYDLKTGQTQKALQEIQPILNHEISCAEVPGLTYSILTEYYCEQREDEKAKEYFWLLYHEVFKRKAFSLTGKTIGDMFFYCSIYDHALGIEIYQKVIGQEQKDRNPYYKMQFAKGAYRLFYALKEEREFLNISLPVTAIEKTKDGYLVSALSDFYYQEYMEIAKKFDDRNGNSKYVNELK